MADQAEGSSGAAWRVPAQMEGARLDAFLRHALSHLSRRRIEILLRENLFTINGRRGRKGDFLNRADHVAFAGPASWLERAPVPQAELEVPIVYQDDWLIALNKPAGMPTHGFSARHKNTVANFLVHRFPLLDGIGRSRWEPGLVHRLDAQTSGLVVAARTPAAFENLRRQFQRREVIKLYWALVWGATQPEGSIDYPIAHRPRDQTRMLALVREGPDPKKIKSWPALTRYRRLSRRGDASLVELRMETGVTHQLRVHLAALGHPIIGDPLYGEAGGESFGLKRHFLHAKELVLRHPRDGRKLRLEAALAPELQEVLARLGMRC